MRSLVAAAAALAASTATAAADATIIKGGPRGDDAGVAAALADANAAMGVCWRLESRPSAVEVKVEVMRDMTLIATPVGPTKANKCAAGVLGVWTLPGGAWAGVIRFSPSAPVDLSALIQKRFLERSASIQACQSKAPSAAGPVMIKMKVDPKGSLSNVEVRSALGAAIDGCVKAAVGALTLDALPAKAPVDYALGVTFAGKRGGATAEAPAEAPGGGTVGGALTSTQVGKVMSDHRARLLACGKQGKAKGTLVTRFTIRPDGTTKNVVIKEPIGDAAIEACLVGVYKSLTFPTAGEETKVSYPISFR